jgi:glycosyltransferase involved in cell wall biosynthesis
MRVFCHVPRENWFGDRYGAEYKRVSRHEVSHTDLDCDIIWLLADWCWRQIPTQVLKEKPVVCTVHHIVPEKFDEIAQKDFFMRDQFVDAYHVPCDQTRLFISKYTSKPINKIVYWVDPNLWPIREKREMKKIFSLPEDKLIVGSFQRDTEGHDLKSPKLEKGPDKLCDYIEKIRSSGTVPLVLLNGWRRQYVINRLESVDIEYMYKELPPLSEVSLMYSACDLYVVGSRWEGGPQSILECAVSKTPIVSTDMGIARDVLPDACIFDVGKDCEVYYPDQKDIEQAYDKALQYRLSHHVIQYDDFFEKVLGDFK